MRTLVFKPHSELFHLNKPLVPGVEIKLRFMFNSPDFFLNGVALHGRLTPRDLEMTFHLCQLTLSAPLYKILDTAKWPSTRRCAVRFACFLTPPISWNSTKAICIKDASPIGWWWACCIPCPTTAMWLIRRFPSKSSG